MLYFNPKPDFQLLSKYFKLPFTEEQMQYYQNNGFDIVINWYETEEEIERIRKGFEDIIVKYRLEHHYDNLLYCILWR